jgi:hypothetical protein
MKKKLESPSGLCLLCGKSSKPMEHVDSNKDFVCSYCVLYLVEHPRKQGERIEDVLKRKATEATADGD